MKNSKQNNVLSAQSQKVKTINFMITVADKNSTKCPSIDYKNPNLNNPRKIRFKNGVECILVDGDIPFDLSTNDLVKKHSEKYNLIIQHNKELNKSILILTNF